MRVNLSPEVPLTREVHLKASSGGKTFFEHLEASSKDYIKQHLDQEFEVIFELGRRLSRSLSLADLKKYKQKVREFLNLCVSEGLSYEEHKLPFRNGRNKVLSIVNTVNQKLLNLAELLISENQDSIRVMALVDEIRGLLLDLYA